jgi:hypothetical protein
MLERNYRAQYARKDKIKKSQEISYGNRQHYHNHGKEESLASGWPNHMSKLGLCFF